MLEKKKQLNSEEKDLINEALQIAGILEGSHNIQRAEAGMTNDMYLFERESGKYLLRIPGKGTEHLVNRQQEAKVYELLKGKEITEEVIYINGKNGIKVTKFLEDSHVCNIKDWDEVEACIKHLRQFHEMDLKIDHEFNIYKKIDEYEAKCKEEINRIEDYQVVRKQIMNLRGIIEHGDKRYCLCHIDPITDNFLIENGNIYLIDWEYAAMCDPLIDIAMFCIYSELNKEETDRIINIYFNGHSNQEERRKVYAYMAASAFLWVLWSEIKNISGNNFEEYKMRQYEIAKEFCQYANR
ncbi:MAG: phosphotransferase [Epulopiscium sp.]|nr:phosphotransferase [Candidatus Epulonipiscium sp.]